MIEADVDGWSLRSVMRRVPSPVTVVTAATAQEARGITIGSLTSVSLDPPLICFNVNHEARMHGVITTVQHFAVHIVTEDQVPLCHRFAQPDLTGAEQFEKVGYTLDEQGVPVLEDVLAVLHCQRHADFEAGDHSIVVGRVVDIEESGSGRPLVYHQRAYREVGEEVSPSLLDPIKRASNGTS